MVFYFTVREDVMVNTEHDPEIVKEVVLNSHGNFARVRELIEGDPSLLNVSAPWDETPLQAASHVGNTQIAEWLLERGAPLDIYCAAMLGRGDEVAGFLDADPSLARSSGVHAMPVLFFPATRGNMEVAGLLVERGADVTASPGRNTPLHAAAYFNQPEMATWLLEQGASPTATDYEGKTPIEVAREHGHDDVAQLLERAIG
jgi:ankyrin repeat protein